MPVDPMIARPYVAQFGTTLREALRTKVADDYRNAIMQQDRDEFEWRKQQAAQAQAQALAAEQEDAEEERLWDEAYARRDWGALARMDPQTARALFEFEREQQAPAYAINEQPGPFGSRIVSDGSRFQVVEPQRPAASSAPGYGAPQSGINPATGKPGVYLVNDQGGVKWLDIEPSSPQDRRQVAALRKEFQGLQTYKDYQTVRPLLQSIRTTPDTPSGDIDFIYAVGKILDPGSVVREGEMQLVIRAGSLMEQLLGTTRINLSGRSRFPPGRRKQLSDMLANRVDQYRQAYQADFDRYRQYADSAGYEPFDIVGHGLDAAAAPAARGSPTGPERTDVDPALRERVNRDYYGEP